MSDSKFTPDNCMSDFIEAKLRLINKPHNAFIGSLLYDLNVEATHSVKTVVLDSLKHTIYLNPDYFCPMTHEQQATVLAHEVYHYALMHDIRKGTRNPDVYQRACDEVVNNLLLSSGFEMPFGVNPNTKYRNLATEIVYNMLEEQEQKEKDNQDSDNNSNTKGDGDTNGGLGEDLSNINNNDISDESIQQEINQMQSKITKADTSEQMTSGKSMGNTGSVFEHLFKEIKEGKLKWNVILETYLNELVQADLDYNRFNRRMLQYDLYLPDNKSEANIDKIALAFDVSGSVSEEEATAFLREIKTIKNQIDPEIMSVLTFNHTIVDTFDIKRSDKLKEITMNISGGTNLTPVFDYYKKPENEPRFLIVFSDLECRQIPKKDKPNFDVIWVCINNERAKVNFGKLLHITSKELINA